MRTASRGGREDEVRGLETTERKRLIIDLQISPGYAEDIKRGQEDCLEEERGRGEWRSRVGGGCGGGGGRGGRGESGRGGGKGDRGINEV